MPHDALPLLGTSLDAQRLGWKIERLRAKSTAIWQQWFQATCKPGSFTACSLWRFLAAHNFCRQNMCVAGTNAHYVFLFFRWKLLIVTHCLIERSLKIFCLDMNQFALNLLIHFHSKSTFFRMWKTCPRWWCLTWMEPFSCRSTWVLVVANRSFKGVTRDNW